MGSLRIVAGRWGRRQLKVPRGQAVRPTPARVREAWLSVLTAELPGARVLDLFAGSGALGLEALSRGAAAVTFVERNRGALACLRANIAALDAAEQARVVVADAFAYLGALEVGAFDLALADPPYGRGLAQRLLDLYMRVPFAKIFSVEYETSERLALPPNADVRRYGDTAVAFVAAVDLEEVCQ